MPSAVPTRSIALALALAVACVATGTWSQTLSPEQIRAGVARAGGLSAFLAAQATRNAKLSGQMIDADTELMGAAAVDKTIVQYAKMASFERSQVNIAEAKAIISRHNAAVVCTSPIAEVLIGELGAEYRYMFYSKSGEYLFEYSLDASTCSQYLGR